MQLKAAIRNRAIAEGIPVRVVMQNYLLERFLESMRARWAAYAVDYPYVGDLTLSDACAAVVALMESAGW